ncbi:hypothetical protein, partial [Pseudidiomarina halophila]|uniref:hypothetical protein n=1 Tax=Pseudidiomarina halophila TaxID=1449799 RepID=UPI001A7E0DB3
ISQVYSLRYTKEYSHPKMLFLCLNPVSAHTVCLAWYIVKERSLLLKRDAYFTLSLASVKILSDLFFASASRCWLLSLRLLRQ